MEKFKRQEVEQDCNSRTWYKAVIDCGRSILRTAKKEAQRARDVEWKVQAQTFTHLLSWKSLIYDNSRGTPNDETK